MPVLKGILLSKLQIDLMLPKTFIHYLMLGPNF